MGAPTPDGALLHSGQVRASCKVGFGVRQGQRCVMYAEPIQSSVDGHDSATSGGTGLLVR